jgi:hypothetical protein
MWFVLLRIYQLLHGKFQTPLLAKTAKARPLAKTAPVKAVPCHAKAMPPVSLTDINVPYKPMQESDPSWFRELPDDFVADCEFKMERVWEGVEMHDEVVEIEGGDVDDGCAEDVDVDDGCAKRPRLLPLVVPATALLPPRSTEQVAISRLTGLPLVGKHGSLNRKKSNQRARELARARPSGFGGCGFPQPRRGGDADDWIEDHHLYGPAPPPPPPPPPPIIEY